VIGCPVRDLPRNGHELAVPAHDFYEIGAPPVHQRAAHDDPAEDLPIEAQDVLIEVKAAGCRERRDAPAGQGRDGVGVAARVERPLLREGKNAP